MKATATRAGPDRRGRRADRLGQFVGTFVALRPVVDAVGEGAASILREAGLMRLASAPRNVATALVVELGPSYDELLRERFLAALARTLTRTAGRRTLLAEEPPGGRARRGEPCVAIAFAPIASAGRTRGTEVCSVWDARIEAIPGPLALALPAPGRRSEVASAVGFASDPLAGCSLEQAAARLLAARR